MPFGNELVPQQSVISNVRDAMFMATAQKMVNGDSKDLEAMGRSVAERFDVEVIKEYDQLMYARQDRALMLGNVLDELEKRAPAPSKKRVDAIEKMIADLSVAPVPRRK